MENHNPPPPPRTLKMIKYGTLPFENIAHDLFMVQWHSLEHPGNMRHSEKVKRFWSVGYVHVSYSGNDLSDTCILADIRTRTNTGFLV